MAFLPRWSYLGGDPGVKLFTLARPQLPDVPGNTRVLEIGYRDTDWLKRVKDADPSLHLTGIDWRDVRGTDAALIIQGDVMTADFDRESFAAVVGLSSIEHIGLGHYENDPVDVNGDIRTLVKVRQWLAPNGWCYFDVPYAPEGYWVKGTKCRIYDDAALLERFGPHQVLGYADPNCDAWVEKPTTNHTGSRPYWYVALLVRKE